MKALRLCRSVALVKPHKALEAFVRLAISRKLLTARVSATIKQLELDSTTDQLPENRVVSVGQSVIQPVTVVRDLGVLIDGELSMRQHVTRLAQTCFFHLRRLRSLRRQLGRDVMARLVSALVLSRLDYCNAVLTGLPASTLAPLQRVLHARVVMDL